MAGILEILKKLLGRKQPKPVAKPAAPKREVSVTVGLDFGTCATKCVVNLEGFDRGRDKFLALGFLSGETNHGTLCVPTAIGVDQGRFVFGEEADRLPEGLVIRSFKMAIPCIEQTWGDYCSPFMSPSTPGHFEIQGNRLSGTDLATLYLAVILRYVMRQVTQYLRHQAEVSFYPPRYYLNLAAPLNQLIETSVGAVCAGTDQAGDEVVRDTVVSREYIALGQRALRLSESCQNPWPIEPAIAALEGLKKTEPKRLLLAESPAYVVPETQAAIAGFVNRPGTRSGRFMTLDVGAGSTDVSVFWLEKHDGKVKSWYYASRSLHLGMDAIDRALAAVTQTCPGGSARARREALQRAEGGLAKYRRECQAALMAVDKHRRRTFWEGRAQEVRVYNVRLSDWGNRDRAKVALLLIGGGSHVDLVEELSYGELWQTQIGAPPVEVLGLDVTRQALGPDGREYLIDEVAGLKEQAYLLIIAEGLANRIVDIPPFGFVAGELVKPRPSVPLPLDLWGVADEWYH
jgi:hypothetical protein